MNSPAESSTPDAGLSTGQAGGELSILKPTSPRLVPTHWRWLAPVLLILLILVAFVPALTAGLVDWDDDDLLMIETTYRVLTFDTIRWMFTTTLGGHYQPLTWLSYAFDWWLWKRETFGYHFTSVLLHASSAVVFLFIVMRLIARAHGNSVVSTGVEDRRRGGSGSHLDVAASPEARDYACSTKALILSSAAAAALFAVHPLRVESVAWLAERRDVLSGFFFMLCILFYLRYSENTSAGARQRRSGGLANYLAALVFCALSLLSKASGVTLPIVLLILDVYPLRRVTRDSARPWRGMILEKIPFLFLCLPAAALAYVAQRAQGAMYPLSEYGLVYRFAQAMYGLTFYVIKTIWPTDLGPLYQIPPGDTLLGPLLWQGAAGTAVLVAAAWIFRRRVPAITAAIAFYVIQVFPVLGFAQSGPQLVADRYSYLPCLGFAALAGGGLFRLAAALRGSRRADAHRVIVLTATTAIVVLAHGTFNQSDVWVSPLSLWNRGVQVSPHSSIAHTNRGDAFVQFQLHAAALHEYKTALSLNPKDVVAVRHVAQLLQMHGDHLRAAAFYEYAVTLDPSFAPVYIDYAGALEEAGRLDVAIEVLRARVQAAPDDWACVAFLVHLLSTSPNDDLRNGEEAVALAKRFADRPGGHDARSLLLLATALAEAGRFDEAVAAAAQALSMAEANQDRQRMREIERRLDLFRENAPYRARR